MSPVLFLLLAVGLSAVGTLAVWLWHRRETPIDAGVRDFHRHMAALRPDESTATKPIPEPPPAVDPLPRQPED